MKKSGAICGGNHACLHTKKEFREHIKNTQPGACIDCLCGITYFPKKTKEAKK